MQIYPPVYVLGSLVIMSGLNKYLPIADFSSLAFLVAGTVVTLSGFALIFTTAIQLKKAKTTIKPFADSTALLTSGLFSLSRNPIYLGMVIIIMGVAIAMGSISPFIMPALFTAFIHFKFILKEENHLTKQFGGEYLAYKKSTKRWV